MNIPTATLWRLMLARIKLVALDVDGVLTDGLKHYNAEGMVALSFHARDGLGIYLLLRAGVRVAIVTSGRSNIVKSRAANLGITHILEGVEDKRTAVRELKERFGITTDETLYIGDDLWDLGAFEEVAIRVAVADAHERIRRAADWVTQSKGGWGAVREVADALLEAKGVDTLSLLSICSDEHVLNGEERLRIMAKTDSTSKKEETLMKAVIFERVGGPEVLHVASVQKPSPGYGEVVIRVKACALNRLDYYLRIEEDDAMPMPHILGSDVAGDVHEFGEGAEGWNVGDPVLVSPSMSCGQCNWCRSGSDSLCPSFGILGYQTQGGYAECVVVPARNLLAKPSSLSYEEAASIPLVFTTTYHQLFTRGGLKAGDTVLVMGASSGIGSAAVQLCKAAGARVITTVGGEGKIELAQRLGADVVVDHSKGDWADKIRQATDGDGVDLVCEHFGGEFLVTCIDLLAPGGRLITVGYTVESGLHLDLGTILRKQITIGTSYMGSKAELREALKLIEWGRIKPIVSKVFPLESAREAHELLESRQHFGKIVLRVT